MSKFLKQSRTRVRWATLAVGIGLIIFPSYSTLADEKRSQAQADVGLYGPAENPPPDVQLPTPMAIPDELARAAALAARTHPLINAAEAEVEALEADYRGARWLRFPNLSVEALSATRGSSIADSDGLAVNAAIEQPIWSGGRISSEIDRAQAELGAGENRVGETRQDIVLQVTESYYNFTLADQRVQVLQYSLDEHSRLLAAIDRRVQQEISPRTDYVLGQSRTAQVELELALAEEERESARLRLQELTGSADIHPTLPPMTVAELVPPEEVALTEALACSPSLAALTDLIEVAEAESDWARAQLWPQVLLQLSQNEITGARAAIVLRAQTGNGLAAITAIDSSDARIRRAMAEFGETERSLRSQFRRNYVLLRAASRRIDSGLQAADTADLIIASYERQFVAGRRSWLDVMNAVREAATARLSERDARVTAAAATARILALSCRWQFDPAQTNPHE